MDAIREMGRRLFEANDFGALHIVVADGNMDNSSIYFCLGLADITPEETELCQDLLRMTKRERNLAYRLSDGFARAECFAGDER